MFVKLQNGRFIQLCTYARVKCVEKEFMGCVCIHLHPTNDVIVFALNKLFKCIFYNKSIAV